MSGWVFSMTLAVTGALAMIGTAGASALPRAHRPLYRPVVVPAPEPQPQYGKGGPSDPSPVANGFGERIRTVGDIDGDGLPATLVPRRQYQWRRPPTARFIEPSTKRTTPMISRMMPIV